MKNMLSFASTWSSSNSIFFKELGFVQINPTVIYIDNLLFLDSVVGEKGASIKSKHIMIHLRIINEAYTNGDIDFKHMSTENIPVDMLSKLVPADLKHNETLHNYLTKMGDEWQALVPLEC